MMSLRRVVGAAIAIWALAAGLSFGQQPPTVVRSVPPEQVIAAQLASNDSAVFQQGMAQARNALRNASNKEMAVNDLKRLWLRPLQTGNHLEEVAELAFEGVLARAEDAATVDELLQLRVRTLLALGKADEALANAKSLYNVCLMRNTRQAIDLLCECLAASGKDAALIQRLRLQQVQGALPPSARPAGEAAKSVLAEIKVDPARYLERMRAYINQDAAELNQEVRFSAIMGRANLALLADQAKDAGPQFQRAWAIAVNDQMLKAAEGVARAMRAEDGSVGRANEWIKTGLGDGASAAAK